MIDRFDDQAKGAKSMKTWEEDGLREVLEWCQLWGDLPSRERGLLKVLSPQGSHNPTWKIANWVCAEPA